MRQAEILVEGLLHPREVAQFAALCTESSAEDLKGEWLRVRTHVARLSEFALLNPDIDLETARRIGAILEVLMRDAYSYSGEQRALLRGAAEYFIFVGDDDNDLRSLGFDDDAMVINLVAKALGRSDLQIHLT